MSKNKYDLTISILASNRKDTLPKTLNSIKPILDNISSELIIVDTGCDEELLEVIKKYTDKIIKFEWCNDFSKARNTGLEQAQGDWFMFIDDDEWFEDVTEFLAFFNSDEKNQYSYGKYVVRNYKNKEGTEWSESIAGRMFRILEGTKFVDTIHEKPINIAGPVKNFTAYAHHYGYVYKTEEAKKAHIERNVSLLKKQIESEKNSARHYLHLAQEYCIAKEYDTVIQLCEDGIAKADMSNAENKRDVASLCAMQIWALVNQNRYSMAYEKGIVYIASEICSALGKYAICEFVAVALHMDGKYEQALEYVERYFEYKIYFEEHPEEKFQQSAALIMEASSVASLQRVATIGFEASAFCRDIELLQKYMKYLDFTLPVPMPDKESCMKNIVEMMRDTITLASCSVVADEILKNDSLAIVLLRNIYELRVTDYKIYCKIADIMTMTKSERGHVCYLRIISAKEDIYVERLTLLYAKLMDSDANILTLDNELWEIAIAKRIDLNSLIRKMSVDKWIMMVERWIGDIKIKELIAKKQYLDVLIGADAPHMKYLEMAMSEVLLIRVKLDGITEQRLSDELMNFSNTTIDFYKDVYRQEVFEEHTSVLPERCQAAVLIQKLCNHKVSIADVKGQIIALRPRLEGVIKKYEEIV